MHIGHKNTLKYEINHETVTIEGLPKEFDGYRILHVSDLHIDGMYDHGRTLAKAIKQCDYDLVAITGDFRFLTYGPIDDTVVYMKQLMKSFDKRKRILGILGNHDCVDLVPELEKMGIQMLINESVIIKKGSAKLGIAGVDDPHFYGPADLDTASKDIQKCRNKILLAHSQELIADAIDYGYQYYLCGHTHGGQICLPGGVPLIKNTPRPFRGPYLSGAWQYKGMHGYTSRGVGGSGLPVRFYCPPELIIHTLRSKPDRRQ